MLNIGLAEKSNENIQLSNYCIHSKHYNAGVNRVYYAVFQKIKSYLLDEEFDYKLFLVQNLGKDRERVYSHGTLQQAITYYLRDVKGKPEDELSKNNFGKLDGLFRKRKSADYTNRMCNPGDLEKAKIHAKSMIEYIDNL
jgi:hypothetical protein